MDARSASTTDNLADLPQAQVGQVRVALRVHAELPGLLLPRDTPSQVAVTEDVALVPNVKPWFRGVHGMRGSLVPVFDVAAWLGFPTAHLNAGKLLILDMGTRPLALVCTDVPEIVTVLADDTPWPHASEKLGAFIKAAYQGPRTKLYEFDYRSWVAHVASELQGN